MQIALKNIKENKYTPFVIIGILYMSTLLFANVLFKDETIYFYKWTLMLLLIGLPMLPITNCLFKNFDDKGYFFSKTIGITIFSLFFFWLSSFKILKFTTTNCLLVIGLITIGIYAIWYLKEKNKLQKETTQNNENIFLSFSFTNKNLKYILIEELMFLVLLTFLMYLKGYNSAAYGTERFMDYGFMSSMMLTDYFPVEDFWFSNTNLNYYYIGQYIATFMTKISFIGVEYSYNLMLMTICAMGFVQSFSIVQTLLKEKLTNKKKQAFSNIGGIIAGIAVCFMGNFHYVLFKWVFPFLNKYMDLETMLGITIKPSEDYWFPTSTRYIGYNPEVADKTIHEYPSYSFVLGDLHAHVVNIIFVLTIIAILLAFALNQKDQKLNYFKNEKLFKKKRKNEEQPRSIETIWNELNKKELVKELFSPTTLLVGLFLGLFNGTNYWDFPIYFVVSGAIILYVNFKKLGFSFKTLFFTLLQGAIILLLSQLVMLPFLMHFSKMASEICIAKNHTAFSQLLVLWGFPVACVLVGIIVTIIDYVQEYKKNDKALSKIKIFTKNNIEEFLEKLSVVDMFMILISCCAIGLVFVPEVLYVKDIYGDVYARCNTMFKLVYQAFILFGLGIGYYITKLFVYHSNAINKTFGGLFLLLTILCTGYFYTSCESWFGNVFDQTRYFSLNALSYLETDNTFVYDKDMIEYIKENIDGMPTILEANGDSYTSYNRVSVTTGKPTVLGWYTHEWLWKDNVDIVNKRVADIQTIYTTDDPNVLRSYIDMYDIDYIYVGNNEYNKYEALGLSINIENLKSVGEIVAIIPNPTNMEKSTYLFKIN